MMTYFLLILLHLLERDRVYGTHLHAHGICGLSVLAPVYAHVALHDLSEVDAVGFEDTEGT